VDTGRKEWLLLPTFSPSLKLELMSVAGIRRSFLIGPWHYCARCDRKTHISDMKWQRGLLLCERYCVDKELLGERDVKIAAVLGDGKEELVPVEKLRNPDVFSEDEDFIL
jgi:hypothetical protein